MDQHVKTDKPKTAVERYNNLRQQMLPAEAESQPETTNKFYIELCEAFAAADIPLHKLSNACLRAFLERYTTKSIPNSSTLRNGYVARIYSLKLRNIRDTIGDEPGFSPGRHRASVRCERKCCATSHVLEYPFQWASNLYDSV